MLKIENNNEFNEMKMNEFNRMNENWIKVRRAKSYNDCGTASIF